MDGARGVGAELPGSAPGERVGGTPFTAYFAPDDAPDDPAPAPQWLAASVARPPDSRLPDPSASLVVERAALAAGAAFHLDLSAVEQADPGSLTVDDVGRHVQRHLAAVKAPAPPQVAQAAAAVPPAPAGEADIFAGLYAPGELDADPADPTPGSIDPADEAAIVAAAVRGAFHRDHVAERMDFWRALSAAGEPDVAATVSSLAVVNFPVSRRPTSADVADELEGDADFRAMYGPPPEDSTPSPAYRRLFPPSDL